MRRVIYFVLIALLLGGCSASDPSPGFRSDMATPTTLATITNSLDSQNQEIEEMAAEFRELRPIPGQFDGGQWQKDIDQWMGRKHKLMLELATRLGSGNHTRGDVERLLGPPDHIVHTDHPLMDLILTLPDYEEIEQSETEFLVYEWRGTHDFLFFLSDGDTILGVDWWYASE